MSVRKAPLTPVLVSLGLALVTACAAGTCAAEPPAARATAGDSDAASSLERARAWLASAQSEDGTWSAPEAQELYEVGVTSLSMLALMRSSRDGAGDAWAHSVSRAAEALIEHQDPESGLVGAPAGHAFLYGHGIATLALCELYAATGDARLGERAQAAVDYTLRARNPYSAWRYSVPPDGDNDTSVTGWMLEALSVAKAAGLRIDGEALRGGLSWIDEVSDVETGRVGYDSVGSLSSRIQNVNEHYPHELGEAMTAVGLASRAMLGQDETAAPIMVRHAELLRRNQPEPATEAADLYYWYHGTRAMKAMGGRWWEAWSASATATLTEMQRAEGELDGSWDPIDVWSFAGGRTYTTALATLSLAECL